MPIRATRYLLSVYQPDGPVPAPEALQGIMRDVEALNRDLKAAGAWDFGGGLQPQRTAKVARAEAGAVIVTDGPFAETKEFLGGFCVITAPDFDAAAEWAGRLARATTLPIEVRPFQDET